MKHLYAIVVSDIDCMHIVEAETIEEAIYSITNHNNVMLAMQIPNDAIKIIKKWKGDTQ